MPTEQIVLPVKKNLKKTNIPLRVVKKTAPQYNSNSLNCKKPRAPQYSSAQLRALKITGRDNFISLLLKPP